MKPGYAALMPVFRAAMVTQAASAAEAARRDTGPRIGLVHKILQEERHVAHLQIAALAQLVRYQPIRRVTISQRC